MKWPAAQQPDRTRRCFPFPDQQKTEKNPRAGCDAGTQYWRHHRASPHGKARAPHSQIFSINWLEFSKNWDSAQNDSLDLDNLQKLGPFGLI